MEIKLGEICERYQDPEMVSLFFLTPSENGILEAYADMIQYFYDRGDFETYES